MIVLTMSTDVTDLNTGELWEVEEEIFLQSNLGEVKIRDQAKRNFTYRVAHAMSTHLSMEGGRFQIGKYRIDARRQQATWDRHEGLRLGSRSHRNSALGALRSA
jgi:hypothetical protein